MAAGDAVAADVPGKFDLVVNGKGYMFLDAFQPAGALGAHKANYGYTPTFVARQNVSGNYGDNEQDFFLTASQNNWDLGEAQRYFRSDDQERVRRFWAGTNVDPVTTPGQVSIRNTVGSLTFAAAAGACCEFPTGVYTVTSTKLYLVDSAGTISDKGAHGLGVAPSQWGLASDSVNAYVSSTAGGTAGVRKYTGAAWSTFSANGSDSLAFLNNALYGFREDTGDIVTYSTTGVVTSLFTWRDAAGVALTGSAYASRLKPYGGKLLILRKLGFRRGELWQYDGTGTSKLADFPANFVAQDMDIVSGIAFIGGYINNNSDVRPAIFWYANGVCNLLWQSQTAGYTNLYGPSIAAYGSGIAFTDDSSGKLYQYNLNTGGVHTLGSYTVTNAVPQMAANKDVLLHTRAATAGYYFPTTTVAATATVVTSLYDFNTSLVKTFRGVRLDFDAPAGSTVDIAYQLESVDGAFTTLQTGAASGTEYTLSGVSGRSIALKVTLNKGSSSAGPVLKRSYVRAAPILTAFRRGAYVLNLASRDAKGDVQLRDLTYHPLNGLAQAQNLVTAATSTTPISITDRFGTFTGRIEPDGFEIREIAPEEYIGIVPVREV